MTMTMRTITLTPPRACDYNEDAHTAIGVTQGLSVDVDEGGVLHTYDVLHLPELGPKRLLPKDVDLFAGVVLPIGGRRFKVSLVRDLLSWGRYDDDHYGPIASSVTFEETDEPESPFTPWDWLAVAQRDLARALAEPNPRYPYQAYEIEQKIAAGDFTTFLPTSAWQMSALGQAHFNQDPWYFAHNGKAAACLFSLETWWGDAGNENYFVVLDDDGYPEAVFHEASCC
jgi:hypothetical protein